MLIRCVPLLHVLLLRSSRQGRLFRWRRRAGVSAVSTVIVCAIPPPDFLGSFRRLRAPAGRTEAVPQRVDVLCRRTRTPTCDLDWVYAPITSIDRGHDAKPDALAGVIVECAETAMVRNYSAIVPQYASTNTTARPTFTCRGPCIMVSVSKTAVHVP